MASVKGIHKFWVGSLLSESCCCFYQPPRRDLGLLKRDKALQLRYNAWSADVRKKHGSTVNYLLDYRLQWGKPDTLSLLPSELEESEETATNGSQPSNVVPPYFTADMPFNSDLICIMQNDWPYSVPIEIEHTVIWSRVPIFHPSLIPGAIEARIHQDGLWGFTGSITPIEDLPSLESCLAALADWGVTEESMIRSPKASREEEEMLLHAGKEVDAFVKRRWQESKWETAWFVNPPSLISNSPDRDCKVSLGWRIFTFLRGKKFQKNLRRRTPERDANYPGGNVPTSEEGVESQEYGGSGTGQAGGYVGWTARMGSQGTGEGEDNRSECCKRCGGLDPTITRGYECDCEEYEDLLSTGTRLPPKVLGRDQLLVLMAVFADFSPGEMEKRAGKIIRDPCLEATGETRQRQVCYSSFSLGFQNSPGRQAEG
ncbi:hypothetical protein EDD15DRAFT_2276950 [Pisolithus albus]|nr:hypothetical protein EDD15DRAFT_2276950 [Pisolithus albus]